jgi:hypothetical protein
MEGSCSAVTIATGAGSPSIRDSAADWLRTVRHINRQTLAKMPVGSASGVYFPKLGRESDAVVFPYPHGVKARSYPEKAYRYEKGSKFEFWNIVAVLATCAGKIIYIVEGELDALALVESGANTPYSIDLICPRLAFTSLSATSLRAVRMTKPPQKLNSLILTRTPGADRFYWQNPLIYGPKSHVAALLACHSWHALT